MGIMSVACQEEFCYWWLVWDPEFLHTRKIIQQNNWVSEDFSNLRMQKKKILNILFKITYKNISWLIKRYHKS